MSGISRQDHSSLIFGILGCLICFYITSSASFFKKNFLNFILLYLASYATLMNTNFNQIAGFLFFLIMTGYYSFLKKNDYCSGLFWGLAVAIKLFPGLLFIFALSKQRYKIFWTMLFVLLATWSLPLISMGPKIYLQFFKTISTLIWYGNTWNASIYGFLFRLFVDLNNPHNVSAIKISYQIIFIFILLWYSRELYKPKIQINPHYGFCLSLIIMLLLSPFGWMYYFALLFMPLILIYQSLGQDKSNKKIMLWYLCLFLLNLPIANFQTRSLEWLPKIGLYSSYFYGLVLVLYLFLYTLKVNAKIKLLTEPSNSNYLMPVEFILGFSVFIVFTTLLRYWYL